MTPYETVPAFPSTLACLRAGARFVQSLIMKRSLTTLLLAALLPLSALAADKGEAPLKVSHGAEVQITDYLVPGKTTIVDFTSNYCPPCRAISPKLDALHQTRDDIAVVKVDINRPDVKGIDWKSPVVQQYGIRSVPHFKVFDAQGKLIAEGRDAAEMVYGMVE